MTYQTLPIFFHFSNSSASPPPPPLSPSPSQVETDMECVDTAAALKSSFRPEMAAVVKPTPQPQQVVIDEVWCGNGGVGGDDFVDELFDFSNEDDDLSSPKEEEEQEEKGCCCASSSLEETHLGENSNSNSNSCVSVMEDFGAELGVPTDDLANLEWLSHFVEDSFSEFPPCSRGTVPFLRENPNATEDGKSQSLPQNGAKENGARCLGLTMETQVPAKARRKRSRTGGRVWSFHRPHFVESSPTSSSSSSSSSPSSCLIFANTGQNPDIFDCLGKPPSKRPKPNKFKRKPLVVSENRQSQSQLLPQRRCSHCLVQKTPQWRTGPLGSKTLCNACGVRYKSGRLLPEYRPAGSPTFLSHVHSNNHRKVLEMRRKKDVAAPEPSLPAVQTF